MDQVNFSTLAISDDHANTGAVVEHLLLRMYADGKGYAGKPLSEVPLLTIIPREVRDLIYDEHFGRGEVRVDLTTSRGHTRGLKYGMPNYFQDSKKFLLINKKIHEEVKEYMAGKTIFFNHNADAQPKLNQELGGDVSLVRNFELRLNFKTKCWHRSEWHKLLRSITRLPVLNNLVLFSTSERGRAPYPHNESGDPNGSVTKHQQEFRSLLLLGSFISKRHPNLPVMLLPARSQPNHVNDDDLYVHELKLTKPHPQNGLRINKHKKSLPMTADLIDQVNDSEPQFEIFEDVIINTTAVRRHKWTEIAQADPSTFYIQFENIEEKEQITSSERPGADDAHFAWVDERAYQPRSMFTANNWEITHGRQYYDQLIEHGRREKAAAERRTAREAEREARRAREAEQAEERAAEEARLAARYAAYTARGYSVAPVRGNAGRGRGGVGGQQHTADHQQGTRGGRGGSVRGNRGGRSGRGGRGQRGRGGRGN